MGSPHCHVMDQNSNETSMTLEENLRRSDISARFTCHSGLSEA